MRSRLSATPRRGMSATRRALILERQGGLCAKCSAHGPFDIDHRLSLWMSGPDDDANCEALCIACHAAKTADDAARRAKVKRLIARQDKTRRARKAIPARQWPKMKRPFPKRVVLP
jgi:5-methylcytosine-specific restriction endonuclease McrA